MDTPAEFTGPIYVGNPEELTMLELADHVLKIVGGPSKVEFMPLPEDDPRQRRPNIILAPKVLGWQPSVPLEDGLVQTVAYFRGRLNIRK
jgi:UDP-glucuronate decarboxylase